MSYAFSRRRLTPERMDAPDAERADLEKALWYLARLNRRFCGIRPVLRQLERWTASRPRGDRIRVLDVGTGGADIPIAIADWADRTDRDVHVTAIDAHETTLSIARDRVGARSRIDLVHADARALTDVFKPGSFDYVHASLFLHHLPDIEVLTVLRIMDRLSRHGLIVNDLVRSRAAAVLARLGTMGAGAMVRHDAIVSVQAGFARAEILDMARRVGLRQPTYRTHLLYRFTLVSTK